MGRTASAFVVIGLAALTWSGCSKASPSRVAEQFYDEMAAGDVEGAQALSTPRTAEMIGRLIDAHGPEVLGPISNRKASGEMIEGDTAIVSFLSEDGSTSTVPLVKLDGEWKVDFASLFDRMVRPKAPGRSAPKSL